MAWELSSDSILYESEKVAENFCEEFFECWLSNMGLRDLVKKVSAFFYEVANSDPPFMKKPEKKLLRRLYRKLFDAVEVAGFEWSALQKAFEDSAEDFIKNTYEILSIIESVDKRAVLSKIKVPATLQGEIRNEGAQSKPSA
jgi:hypothetical protein